MKSVIAIALLVLVLIVGFAFVFYPAQKKVWITAKRVEFAGHLLNTYNKYLATSTNGQIVTADFRQMAIARLTMSGVAYEVAAHAGTIETNSTAYICVVNCRDLAIVAIRGNGVIVFLTKAEFDSWVRETEGEK